MKTMLKRVSAGLLALTLALSLAACGGASSSQAASGSTPSASASGAAPAADPTAQSEDATLTVAMTSEPTALCSLGGTVLETQVVITNAMDGRLMEFNAETAEISPSLAESWEQVDDTHVRIHLRQDACYSDGTPVTAEDVVYSFTTATENAAAFTNYFDPAGFVAEDEHTVLLAFTQYVPGWEQVLANPGATITSKANVEAVGGLENADRNPPIGCGRYVFKEWVSGQYITIERNENYWDPDYKGYYKTIKFTFVPDAASRVLAIKSGDVDVAMRISMSDYMALQNDPTAKGVPFATDRIYNLFFNVSEGSVFSDPLLRQAVACAVDAEAVNSLQNMGQGKVVQGQWAETHPYYKEVYAGGHPALDQDKAKELMAQAGHGDGFSCKLITGAATQSIATVLQESLRQVGIDVDVQVMEQSAYVAAARAGEYDCYIGATTAGTLSPDNFNQSDPAKIGVTVGGYRDASGEMAALIEKASSPDEATAKEGWDELYDRVLGGYYCVGLCNSIDCYALAKDLDGLVLGKLNYMDVSYVRPAA